MVTVTLAVYIRAFYDCVKPRTLVPDKRNRKLTHRRCRPYLAICSAAGLVSGSHAAYEQTVLSLYVHLKRWLRLKRT
jgi:hypothetical protein